MTDSFATSVAPCPHAGVCGGCAYQGVPYEEQLAIKNKAVLAHLEENGITPVEYRPVRATGERFGYRNKMEYSFGDETKGGPMTLGLHKQGSYMSVINTGGCLIVPEAFNRIRAAAYEWAVSSGHGFFHKRSHSGFLRSLVLRRGERTGELLVNLVTTSEEALDESAFCEAVFAALGKTGRREESGGEASRNSVGDTVAVRTIATTGHSEDSAGEADCQSAGDSAVVRTIATTGHSEESVGEADRKYGPASAETIGNSGSASSETIAGILHTINDRRSDVVACDSVKTLYGRDHYFEELLGLSFRVGAFSFFQTNTTAVESMLREALRLIPDGRVQNLYDVYCGAGTISLALSRQAENVTGVELNEDSVLSARENAACNGVGNCSFICGDAFEELSKLPAPDLLVVDPPRMGLHPKALKRVIEFDLPFILYISCNPKTFAQNAAALKNAGYCIPVLGAYDNFPFTKHIETAALLHKTK